jgi:hypothetical protein
MDEQFMKTHCAAACHVCHISVWTILWTVSMLIWMACWCRSLVVKIAPYNRMPTTTNCSYFDWLAFIRVHSYSCDMLMNVCNTLPMFRAEDLSALAETIVATWNYSMKFIYFLKMNLS